MHPASNVLNSLVKKAIASNRNLGNDTVRVLESSQYGSEEQLVSPTICRKILLKQVKFHATGTHQLRLGAGWS